MRIFRYMWNDFNPRSRERSDPFMEIFDKTYPIFQSTLPRKERHPLAVLKIVGLLFQSTLPRKERRVVLCVRDKSCLISIHAPAKGATSIINIPRPIRCHFNPRSRERSDKNVYKNTTHSFISIHAPAKGATVKRQIREDEHIFQSTLPRKERHTPRSRYSYCY